MGYDQLHGVRQRGNLFCRFFLWLASLLSSVELVVVPDVFDQDCAVLLEHFLKPGQAGQDVLIFDSALPDHANRLLKLGLVHPEQTLEENPITGAY